MSNWRWKTTNENFQSCPNCGDTLISFSKHVICANCAEKEIERLQSELDDIKRIATEEIGDLLSEGVDAKVKDGKVIDVALYNNPLGERLPENGDINVLALAKVSQEVFILAYDGDCWFLPFDENGDEFQLQITHWQPLPEAPAPE